MEQNKEIKFSKIGFFKKIWLSITKFEKYPEMATEGVGRAFLYLSQLILIFSIIIMIGFMYNFNNELNQIKKFVNDNINEISYQNGNLSIIPKESDTLIIESDFSNFIVDTNTIDSDQINEYEDTIKSTNIGILCLKNKVIVYTNGVEQGYSYRNAFQSLGINSLSKADLIGYLSDYKIYIAYFISMFIFTFLIYLISTLIDVLVLSVFGLLTMFLLRIKIRYRAIFNMSTYALTISILLKMVYVTSNMFVDFEIKYFDFMYSAIGYICLVASIFMLKSDIIKQQIELMRIANEKKKEEQEEQTEEKDEKKNQEEKGDKKDKKQEKKEPDIDDDKESQGSEA